MQTQAAAARTPAAPSPGGPSAAGPSGPAGAASDPLAAASAASGAASAGTVAPGLPLIRAQDDDVSAGSFLPALGLLMLAAAVALWLLKRHGWQRLKTLAPGGRQRLVQVRETLHVSPKVRVTYLHCEGHDLLLAHSDHSQSWVMLPPRKDGEGGDAA